MAIDDGPATDDVARRFDHYSPEFVLDPAPTYAHLRQQCPVGRAETYGGFWIFSKYEDVYRAYHEPEVFSSYPISTPPNMGQMERLIPVEIDPPDHRHYRRIVDPLFGPKEVNGLEPALRAHAIELIDTILAKGECDFIAEFAVPYPSAAFLELMGLPIADRDMFVGWKDRIIHGLGAAPGDVAALDEVRTQAGLEIYAYFAELLDARSEQLTDDLVSHLLRARFAGERELSQFEVLNFCFLLFIAGLDTVTSALGHSILHLGRRPDLQDRLAEEPALIPSAIEELLRWESPVFPGRTVMAPCTVRGVELEPGDRVMLLTGSAGLDEDAFERADELILDRHPNRHIAFGAGNHRCLGSHLARLELRVAFEEIVRRMPRFSIPEGAEIHAHGGGVKGIGNLPFRVGRE